MQTPLQSLLLQGSSKNYLELQVLCVSACVFDILSFGLDLSYKGPCLQRTLQRSSSNLGVVNCMFFFRSIINSLATITSQQAIVVDLLKKSRSQDHAHEKNSSQKNGMNLSHFPI